MDLVVLEDDVVLFLLLEDEVNVTSAGSDMNVHIVSSSSSSNGNGESSMSSDPNCFGLLVGLVVAIWRTFVPALTNSDVA